MKSPRPVPRWIATKRDGLPLDPAVIDDFIAGAADGSIPDYQVAAMLMAVVFRGLDEAELVRWTRAMIASGDTMSLKAVPGVKVDKHSTGGVGDKLSLCLAPAVAACGVKVPMLAGRALGHTGGTLDKLEAITGFRVSLSSREFVKVLGKAGWVIAGQTPKLVPADRVLYALRDATATVESIPLIASSILSKKIAGGADALLMDVKVGRGAFLPSLKQGKELAQTIVRLGKAAGLKTIATLTNMDEPLGRKIGNATEVVESIEVLQGGGPPDVRSLTVRLGAEMLVLAGAHKSAKEAGAAIETVLNNGDAFKLFRQAVQLQGGDVRLVDEPKRLARAKKSWIFEAPRAGVLDTVDAKHMGIAATVLGAGRSRKEDKVDPGVGITLHERGGVHVERGQPLCTVWYNEPRRLQAAQAELAQAFVVGTKRPPVRPLVRGTIS
ncbi:MAG: thymidine phosphorylase [Deltaproteobacteria bacterium]|nr:thymidine phosphorylase [Deltaproteobacteria bacterium]